MTSTRAGSSDVVLWRSLGMERPTWRSLVSWALRLVLVAVFLFAGLTKAKDPQAFADQIRGFQIVPYWAATAMALYIPWLETFTGFGLLLRRFVPGALLTATFLLVVFMAAVASAWYRGLDASCGCFGATDVGTTYSRVLIRDGVLLVVIVTAALLGRQRAAA